MERDFKGVWIPKEIWLSTELTLREKVVLVEIDSLCRLPDGCYASNNHFAKYFGIASSNVSRVVSSLHKKGYITKEYIRDGKVIKKRIIKIVKEGGYYQNALPGSIKTSIGGSIKTSKGVIQEDLVIQKEGEAPASTPPAPVNGRFKRPTLETLRQYFVEIDMPPGVVDAEAKMFMNHFDACGWVVGRDKPMKDWQAAARTWEGKRQKFSAKAGGPKSVTKTGIPLEERIARAKKREEEIWRS